LAEKEPIVCKIKGIPFRFHSSLDMRVLLSRRGFLLPACALLVVLNAAYGQQQQSPGQNPPAQNPDRNQGPLDQRIPPPQKTPAPQGEKNAPGSSDTGPKAGAPGGPGAPVDSATYKIGPADVLLIRVWNEAQFTGPVAVHQDGKFTLPLVGDLEAGDHTPAEVEKIIAQALTKYVVKPLVTVTVQEVGSKRYYMDGMVNRPGEYPLIVPTTILEAISKAGGLQEFANQKKIYVLRGDQRIFFNYKDVLRGKHMDQNILLKPGDHIVAQ
jgi:polysaccharide export outer membrane protein